MSSGQRSITAGVRTQSRVIFIALVQRMIHNLETKKAAIRQHIVVASFVDDRRVRATIVEMVQYSVFLQIASAMPKR